MIGAPCGLPGRDRFAGNYWGTIEGSIVMGTKREAFEWRLAATRSNAELAYDRLRQAIVDGQFEPGQRLTEVGIAAMLGVSRTPVRESFLRLEADGLLRCI
jgi:DNA-binding GntR family transcriptional regulator